jgi:hypothetical protein
VQARAVCWGRVFQGFGRPYLAGGVEESKTNFLFHKFLKEVEK